MKGLSHWDGWTALKDVGWNVGLMFAGSLVIGVGINGLLVPHRFVSGGVTGLSLLLHYLVPSLSVALIYVIANVPL